MTRFNVRGMDLNRNWDKPADPVLAPENHALEQWFESMIAEGRRPHMYIDLHNDLRGNVSLESTLGEHTVFTRGTDFDPKKPRQARSRSGGITARYGIIRSVREFSADYVLGLGTLASAKLWKEYGASLPAAFSAYFEKVTNK